MFHWVWVVQPTSWVSPARWKNIPVQWALVNNSVSRMPWRNKSFLHKFQWALKTIHIMDALLQCTHIMFQFCLFCI